MGPFIYVLCGECGLLNSGRDVFQTTFIYSPILLHVAVGLSLLIYIRGRIQVRASSQSTSSLPNKIRGPLPVLSEEHWKYVIKKHISKHISK